MKRQLFAVILVATLLVAAYARNGLWQDDMTIWADALDKSPRKARGLNELGIYYVGKQDYEKALAALRKSLELNRYQPAVYLNMGLAYEGLNRIDLAIEMYTTAAQYQPDDPVAYYNLGVLYYKTLHDLDRAFELLRKARDLNPSEPDVHLYLSYIYRDRGEFEHADEEYRLHLMLK
jgi:protein O-mannosyl-transferase